ncbi:cystine/glutamate transporter-like [Lissotriton helveticus]
METAPESKKDEEPKDEAVHLKREITLLQAIALTIGTIIGSGIFISPKGVLMNSGNIGLSLLVWLACGVLSMFGALCYADLGTTIKKSGGHYIYILETLGPLPAFLRVWLEFILIRPASAAVVALAFGRYVIEPLFMPCHAPILAVKLITALGVCLVIALNCWSVSWAANLQTALMVLKLVAITLIIVPGMVALFSGHTEHFQDPFDSSSLALDKLPLAFYSGMFAYGGWFFTSYVTEEIVNPERNIPIAVIVSVSIVTVAYVLANVSYYTFLTVEEVLASKAVAMSFADIALNRFSPAIPILVALSCFGTLNGGIFASARIFFVASRERQWPHLFSMIHIERHTPLPALILMLPVIFLMVSIGDLYGLLNFFSFCRWLFIGLATLGLVIHRFKYPDLPRPFKVPIFIPVVFTVTCLFIVGMSLYSDPFNTGMGCAITLSGIPLYYLMVKNPRVPEKCMAAFNSLTMKLQLLLTVIPQEIKTF